MNKKSDYFVPTYSRTNPAMVKGKGVWLWDARGKKYLDFGSGIAVHALGHAHPLLVKTLVDQGKRLLHVSNLYMCEPQTRLCRLLVKKSFGDAVFFCNSGTEAVEAAIKFSRKWALQKKKEKFHVLSFSEGFHGRTYGALSATAQKKLHQGFGPMLRGFHYAPYNNIKRARKELERREYAAVIVEPLQGESGFNMADTAFLQFLREYTRKKGIALVFDEIQCGIGRTGTLWNYEQHGITPDLMTLAKPLGGGLPLGAVVCKGEIAACIQPGDHGTTFGGNPLACALGHVVLSQVSQPSFLRQVRKMGAMLKNALEEIIGSDERCTAVVGTGLMVGVRVKADHAGLISAAKKEGLLLIKAGNGTVRFLPPLNVNAAEVERALTLFSRACRNWKPA